MNRVVKPIRLVLADDHPLIRAGLRAELEKLPQVRLVGEAGNGQEALTLVKSLRPDIAFIDISMPILNGLEVLARLVKECPEVRVVMLSMHDNEEYIWRAMRAGAAGFVLKKAATTELGTAIQKVMKGENYLCREIAERLAKKFPQAGIAGTKSPVEQLNGRQREILQLIAEGWNTKEIADIIKLSPKTVEYHRMKLMQNLDVHDIPGLVRFALQVGLVTPEF